MIKSGRVSVNGRTGQLNSEVTGQDDVWMDGQKIILQSYRYILLYKPAGYVTTLKDPQGRNKVTDLIKIPQRVVPVGRLDYDTTGVLLLTNDGDVANSLMHPRREVDKVYEVEVDGVVTPKILNLLSIGVEIDGKLSAPAKARQTGMKKLQLTIHEGRKHQVKKMCLAVGLTVTKLHRSKYADLVLTGLVPGQWRDLTSEEVKNIRKVLK